MILTILRLLSLISATLRLRSDLALENLALRHYAELSTSTSWTSAFEFSSPLVLLHYLIDRLRLPLDRVELFTRLAMIGA